MKINSNFYEYNFSFMLWKDVAPSLRHMTAYVLMVKETQLFIII